MITKEIIEDIERLSVIEFRVFKHLGDGLKTKEIAGVKGYVVSVKTIETHIAHIKDKLSNKENRLTVGQIRILAGQYNLLVSQGKITVSPEIPRHKRNRTVTLKEELPICGI